LDAGRTVSADRAGLLIPAGAAPLPPTSPHAPGPGRRTLISLLVVLNLALGGYYLGWRYLYSLNWAAWPLALALVAAETYSYLDAWLFGLAMLRLRVRGEPPPPLPDATVDVFITCYNEPVELVRRTVRAAAAIRHRHRTYVLDDGDSEPMRAMAEAEGVGYIVRSLDWQGRQRHAKAGNLNNALLQTQAEFLLILDADQIPDPAILDRTLGYFRDENVGFVQTPQWFYNVPPSDPLGCQALLFYGPIMQGKDGWNAAFFCGSNAVLRREALMRLGITRYVRELSGRVSVALDSAERLLRRAEGDVPGEAYARARAALGELRGVVAEARVRLRAGDPIQEVTWTFQRQAEEVSRLLVADDLAAIRAELAEIPGLEAGDVDAHLADALDDPATLGALTGRVGSPLAAVGAVRALLLAVDVDRADEAQPLMPLATISVTEDMATAMRLHALGWRSVYHNEILARGLAPDDLRSSLQQRLRWAQGTIQVMLRENPFVQRGLSIGQRLMYFATMWSYLSGFFALIYIAAPIAYLVFGLLPVTAYSVDFFLHLIPYLLVNQLLFVIVGWGRPTFRGQQYSLALFPLWIRAAWTAAGNVWFGHKLGFVVTPKTRQVGQVDLRLVTWQLVAIGLLVLATVYGVTALALGATRNPIAVLVNTLWVCYDLVMLSVVVPAARYAAPEEEPAEGETAAEAHGRAMAGAR
jgi:cellulose synthase/poly-beta-1,6-N-acetylglucosamine synthase-like glycosyltransferase